MPARCTEILEEAGEIANGSDLVFPSSRQGKVIDGRTLGRTLQDAGIEGTAVHGLRSSFRDWCADTGQPREIAEAALAHIVGGVEGAYFRSDLFERRREVMDDWAAYISR